MDDDRRWGRIGGHVVLDLVDTVSWRLDPARRADRIPDADALVAWAAERQVIGAGTAEALARQSADGVDGAADALIDVHQLREAVSVVLDAALGRPGAGTLAAPVRFVRERYERALAIAEVPARLPLTWQLTPSTMPELAAVLALQAGDFLREGHADLRCCAGPGCGWLFLDTSRNHSRRWCDSSDCGNRVRVARHARRQRPATS